ncbi:Xaa-Pro peptidase family protein [Candidatus Micrarchaeota archaeon]|nr:Xaa-Pro peptidase family protein [Candidatus Micrarchaeota archaeon]
MKQKVNELFRETKIDSILIRNFSSSSDPNFFYFTQLYGGNYSINSLILGKGKKPLLLSNKLEFDSIPKSTLYSKKIFEKEKEMLQLLKQNLKGKRIGINAKIFPLSSCKKLRKILKGKNLVDVSASLEKIRETKTREEIKKIRKACSISQRVLDSVPSIFRKGMSELELRNELEYRAKKLGGEDFSYKTIVASGKNSAFPHHRTGNKKIVRDSILLIDFGAKYKGYCSDLSRTFFVGKAKEKHKKIYSTVYRAQQESIKAVREGMDSKKLFLTADNKLKKELNQNLIHGLGHGVGIEVHDFPGKIGKEKSFKLKEGMILAIEPGYYKKGFGGMRIEDTVLVKKNCFEPLSRAPKELIEL